MDISGRRVVVTGASQGIGEAMARAFAAAGAEVVVAARSATKLTALVDEIGGTARPVDLLDPAQVDAFVGDIERDLGPIDVLCNNAGIESQDSVATMDVDAIRRVVRLNLEAPMVLTRLALPAMLRRGEGHLVYTSSLAGTTAYPGVGPNCGTKAGLTNYASAVRSEVAALGVGVTIVAPGPVDTEMWDQLEAAGEGAQAVIARLRRLQLIPKMRPESLATQVVEAVRSGKRHVRHPKRLAAQFWLNEAPRRITELVLAGVPYDPLVKSPTDVRR
jgi:short-subunit dehydrogenase